ELRVLRTDRCNESRPEPGPRDRGCWPVLKTAAEFLEPPSSDGLSASPSSPPSRLTYQFRRLPLRPPLASRTDDRNRPHTALGFQTASPICSVIQTAPSPTPCNLVWLPAPASRAQTASRSPDRKSTRLNS